MMKDIRFGVIGNMGPEADALFQDIVAKTEMQHGALKDQDHMAMIVVKNSDIPDRSEAINEGGKDPVPELSKSAKLLANCGVQFAVMTCNTAHYFRDEVQKHSPVYLLDMLQTTAQLIKDKDPESIVGILCTNGTYNSGIYDRYLEQANLVFVKPQAYEQEHYVHSAIYGEVTGEKSAAGQAVRQANGIKSGEFDRNAELLAKAIESLVAKGVNTIILGCTELPLVRKQLEQAFPNLNFIDPMEAVAERAVEIYQQAEQALKQGALAEVIPAISDIHNNQDIVNYVLSRARV
ncbi:amino acid racemase [Agarivorans aestuarii]|uniref:Amino acid racemase n=1 Tax=Agarivorans aestuarii TaxID=1563703 RepID=A0ABU7G714_9ALTE|nr:amino acid racemase [Agarivorans aestuarii]MEE1675198.1 amino acid racemase [Agarivorans aestuarii]